MPTATRLPMQQILVIRKAAFTKISHDAIALTKAAFYIFLSVSIGAVLGLAIPHVLDKPPPPEPDPKGARQLTLEEALALEWAMSDVGKSARENPELVRWATSTQGQYAKELMEWNQVLLSKRGGTFLCERDAEKLGSGAAFGGASQQKEVFVLCGCDRLANVGTWNKYL